MCNVIRRHELAWKQYGSPQVQAAAAEAKRAEAAAKELAEEAQLEAATAPASSAAAPSAAPAVQAGASSTVTTSASMRHSAPSTEVVDDAKSVGVDETKSRSKQK